MGLELDPNRYANQWHQMEYRIFYQIEKDRLSRNWE
jgi:hypothetical protein